MSIVPQQARQPRTIPVTKEQLEGVLDPMSGAFLFARIPTIRTATSKVCDQTLPVFDGRQRFDLMITPKRSGQRAKRNSSTGYAGPAVICRVKFIPIAGYQPDNPGIKLMSQTNEIEVWLVSVRGTEMYVPYRIVLPTPVGYGSALSTSIQVGECAKRASARAMSPVTCRACQGLTARPQIPICSREQMPKINPPLIRPCSVPFAFLGA